MLCTLLSIGNNLRLDTTSINDWNATAELTGNW